LSGGGQTEVNFFSPFFLVGRYLLHNRYSVQYFFTGFLIKLLGRNCARVWRDWNQNFCSIHWQSRQDTSTFRIKLIQSQPNLILNWASTCSSFSISYGLIQRRTWFVRPFANGEGAGVWEGDVSLFWTKSMLMFFVIYLPSLIRIRQTQMNPDPILIETLLK
jgi:hypothetical protein